MKNAFQDVGLSDSLRMEAARTLLAAGEIEYLVENYSVRNNRLIERALIEERVAAEDGAVLPLVLGLFRAVGGEERIDFEVYLLRFGRRAEGELMALLRSEDASLVMRTMDALARMKSQAAVDSIAVRLRHPDAWVRMAAAHALGEIGGRKAVPFLLSALGDTTYQVVNAALVGLGRLKAPEAYGPSIDLIGNDNPHIRKHAALTLGELGDTRAVPAVRALAREDTDAGVRFMATKALQKLEGTR